MPRNRTPRPRPVSSGYASSEFRLAWIVPLLAAVLAALLEWAGKLPIWAQSPIVLSVAMLSGTSIVVAYILSRGLAKHETRGATLSRRDAGPGVEPPDPWPKG